MYNRYIPQPDGTFQRKRVDEPRQPPQHSAPPPEPPCPPPQPEQSAPCPRPEAHCPTAKPVGFLQQLLPRDFDTGDLMVILLLLLIAGDCEQQRGNALLTLALYFIM